MPSRKYNRGRWSVQQERCHLDPDTDPPPDSGLATVGQLIPSLMKSFGLEDKFWEQNLVNDWEKIVGAQVAKNSRPGRVSRQTLFVFVKNSSWLNELVRNGQKQILANVQAQFGAEKIKSVRIQLDPEG